MMADYEDELLQGGIDYADAMDRFGGNAELFERLALKFLDDPHFEALERSLSEGDVETAYHEAHSLKGVAGNLSFKDLYEAASRLSEALKSGDLSAAQELMGPARDAHETVMTTLRMVEN